LKDVEGASKLEVIDIRNTDIDDGLLYLPDSVEFFCCRWDLINNTGVKKISDAFKNGGEKEAELLNDGSINSDCISGFKEKLKVYKLKEREKTSDKTILALVQELQNLKVEYKSKNSDGEV